MAKRSGPSNAVTPPKGRPTRGRGEFAAERRAFGATAQWVIVTGAIILAIIILVMLTGTGDVGPLHGG